MAAFALPNRGLLKRSPEARFRSGGLPTRMTGLVLREIAARRQSLGARPTRSTGSGGRRRYSYANRAQRWRTSRWSRLPAPVLSARSAVRRRYTRAREAARLRPLRFHALRHAAGSLVAREAGAHFVQAFLGHSRLSTTERYLHAKSRPQDVEMLNRAFAFVQAPVEISTE